VSNKPHLADERGQTMVEFALVLPLMALLLFGVIQFGILFNNYVTLTDAVRAGVRKAAVSRELGPASAVGVTQQAVRDSASDLDPAKFPNATVTSTWEHGDDVSVCGTYPYDIKLLSVVVASGNLKSCTKERVE
jgi:Flp pilus assembly protein TadG